MEFEPDKALWDFQMQKALLGALPIPTEGNANPSILFTWLWSESPERTNDKLILPAKGWAAIKS